MLISIIAARPPCTNSFASPEDELALTQLRSTLEQRQGLRHQVRTASSLGEIVDHLDQLRPGPGDHVQIIGHGMPGMLALGYFWTGVSSNQAGTYVLDSDLSSHSVLDGLIEPGATVSLVGCSIGEDRVGLAQCDGPTLIFDLARMWSCRVDAPVGPVGLDDFDETGRFRTTSPATGACRVVTARDRSVSSLPPPPPVRGFTRTLARIIAVETMRILGPHATEAQQRIVTRGLMALGEIAVEQIPYRPILGLPEIVAKLEDGTVATFLSNASIIRLSAPDPRSPCVAYAPVAASEAIRRIIRSVG